MISNSIYFYGILLECYLFIQKRHIHQKPSGHFFSYFYYRYKVNPRVHFSMLSIPLVSTLHYGPVSTTISKHKTERLSSSQSYSLTIALRKAFYLQCFFYFPGFTFDIKTTVSTCNGIFVETHIFCLVFFKRTHIIIIQQVMIIVHF